MKYAITGGIGSGKSYVCKVLKEEFGIDVYDCDAGAKHVMRSDENLQRRLSQAVGQDVFPGGRLDKAALSAFLLESAENNAVVNGIVHPAVADDFLRSGLEWMESAILFEAGFERYVDKVVCVFAPLEVRIQRVMSRDGITRDKALEWINRQMPQWEKEQRSDFVVVNDGTSSIKEQLNRILTR